VKTDHFSAAPTRIAAAVLAGLLVATGLSAGGFSFNLGKAVSITIESSGKKLAAALTREVTQVEQRFTAKRAALSTVRVAGREPGYLRPEVVGLIAGTRVDLIQAIGQVGEPGLDGLAGWAEEEIGAIEKEAAAASAQAAFELPGRGTPYEVARVAGPAWLALPGFASLGAAAPRQETLSTGTADGLLDRVGAVVSRILFLAEREDLEVKVWVGSTPSSRATFSFWPQGKIKGTTVAPLIIRTNGKKDHVLRGLYAYRAAWENGAVTEVIQFPPLAGAPANQQATERLDLVTGSGFFCCHFNEQLCQHVDDEKECRP